MREDPSEAGSGSEIERIMSQLQALDREGKVDAETLARFDARMQKEFERADGDRARMLAEAHAGFAALSRPPSLTWPRAAVIVGMFLVLAGAALEITIGRRFVFSFAGAYHSVKPWLVLVILVLFSVAVFRSEELVAGFRTRFPTWWVRWLLAFPVTAMLVSLVLVVAPLGWAALLGPVVGASPEELQAKLLSVRERSPDPYDCTRRGTLQLSHVTAEICLDGLVTGRIPNAGDSLTTIVGRQSVFGLLVDQVHTE